MAEFSAIADDLEVLEAGEYPATFQGVTAPDEPSQYGLFLEWDFSVLTEDGPVNVSGRSSRPDVFTRSTKGRLWYEAIAGRQLGKGEVMTFGKLVGRPCRLALEVRDTEKGAFNRILNVLPAKTPRRPAAPPPPPVEEEWSPRDDEAE